MSMPDPTSHPTKTIAIKASKSKISAEERDDLRLLDEACARLKATLPETPYYLTIPTETKFQYNHWSELEKNSWRDNTFFQPHEEHRQYLSFHYQEHGESLIQARTEVDEERDRRKRLGLNSVVSNSSTPLTKSGAVPKRKINLSDYKAKLAGGKNPIAATTASTPKKESEVQADQVMMDDMLKNEGNPIGKAPVAGQSPKRSFEDEFDDKISATSTFNELPPAKKSRASPTLQPKSATQKSKPATPHGLPPLISPIRGDAPPYGLPAMLSPNLPAAIEDELSRMSDLPSTQPGTPSSAEKPASKSTHGSDTSATQVANASKQSEETARRTGWEERKTKHVPASEKGLVGTAADRPEPGADTAPPKRRQRFIVKLKYGKKNRKRVEQILKLPSMNARQTDARARSESAAPKTEKPGWQDINRVDSAHRPDHGNVVNNRERASSTAKKEVARVPVEKRKPLDDEPQDQQAAKRQRTISNLDGDKRPSTPLPPAIQSPSVTSAKSSAQKLNHLIATPRKDLQAVKMQRSSSSDSTIRTPHASGSTPRPQPTSIPNGKATEIEQWSAMSKKYNDLGRKIKYEWQAIGKQATISEDDKKRSAVLALQCLLSYILAYHCNDTGSRLRRQSRSLDTTWLSMLPLWTTFQRVCQPYTHLEGLRYYLGLVIRNAIAMTTADRIDTARKANDNQALEAAQPSKNSSSDAPTPTPSSGGAAAAAGVPSLEQIRENSIEMARNARDAALRLSAREILQSFPDTWQAAAEDADRPAVGVWEKDSRALLTGRFWLPVSADTTPVQVVRFGLRLLQEWVVKEELSIDMSLKA